MTIIFTPRTLEDFRVIIYKISGSEPLAARKALVRSYCEKYQSHYIVESYLYSPSSSQSIFKLEAVGSASKGYPLQQDNQIPELHIEYPTFDTAEKEALFNALPARRLKPQ